MNFFKSIGDFFGHLFGGNNDEEKKKRDQQQQQAAQSAPQRVQSAVGNFGALQNSVIPVNQPQQSDNHINLTLPGAPLEKVQPTDTRSDAQKQIDQLTAAKLPAAIDNEKRSTSFLDRTFTDPNWQQRAQVEARNQAVREYQDQNGYNSQPAVGNTIRSNIDTSNTLARNAAGGVDSLKKAQDVAETGARVAQYVPITGSVLNLGLAGIDQLSKATGNYQTANDIGNTRNKLDFGMNTDEYNNLSDEQKGKLQVMRNIGLAASPLDFLGFGGLAKAGGIKLAKDAVTQLATRGAVDDATKQALKTGATQLAKDAGVATAAGTGISAGAQQYLTGQVDPLEAVKNGAMVGGTSLLFPGRGLSKATANEVEPGIKSLNPNRESDAITQAVDNTPAYQRRQPTTVSQAADQAEQGIHNVPESALSADARGATGAGASTPLDVPTYLRKNAPQILEKAGNDVNDLDARAAAIRDTMSRSRQFNDRQQIAAAFAESPQKGQATARLIQERNSRVDPEQELKDTIIARNQAAQEARAAAEAQRAQEAIDSPTPVVPPESAPAPVAPPEPTVADLAGNDRPAADIQTAIEEAHNAGDNATVSQLIEKLPDEMKQPMRSALGIAEPAASEVPVVAPRPAEQVPAAPNTHDALVRQFGESMGARKGDYAMRDQLNLDDLKQQASGVVSNMSDDEVLRAFNTASPETMVRDPQSFAVARAALDRLYGMAGDPVAEQQVSNIMDAMDRYVSKSGQGLRVAQEEFDNMPLPMKVRYIVKKIDSANSEQKDYSPLADDPARAEVVEANITGYLKGSQQISERIAQIEGQLENVAESARNGEKVDTNIRGLVKTLKTEKRNLELNNGELAKYYQDLTPGRARGQRVNDFARRMMLASFTGRVNDILTTTANVAHLGLQNLGQGLLAKAVNLVRPGTVSDTTKGTGRLVSGAVEGVKKTIDEVRGGQYAPDVQKALQSNVEARSGLQKARGAVGRTIQAATELATNASEGVRDQRVYQLADKEAAGLGLKGSMRRQYAKARAAVPTRQMQETADALHREVNNLNENPVSRTLNRVASAIEGKSAIGGFLKNQIMPFTSWLGGNIWNSVTDKNVVASAVKVIDAARKGDPEAITRNLSKFANNAAQTYALGYLLTQAGVITNQDAEGYNDAGAYIHIGDRYIPAGFVGFFAPNIVLGNAAYNGLTNHQGDPAAAIADGAGQAIMNLVKSVNLGGALGADTNLARAWDAATKQGGDAADAAATAASGAVGQFIPALAGDVNAVLNNHTDLNPTKEKADTRVEKVNPETGRKNKDYVASAVASLQNRIPGLSQQLPRKADVAAPDLTDRVTRGDRDTTGGKQAKADKQAVVDQTKDFKARNIPDPNGKNFDDAVQARVEDGNYDAAIEGLQAKVAQNEKDKNIPASKTKKIQDQIKTLQVAKSGKYDPSVIDLYKKTSLTEWRDMGDPKSDNYDPKTYQMLFNYDSDLAKNSVSRNTTKADKNFYFAKEKKAATGGRSSGAKAASAALRLAQSNKIGDLPALSKVSLGDLAPQKAGSIKMPTIQQLKASDLVKKRKISVGKS